MDNLRVDCACGRQMVVDALRGRGTYRCGCGTGVRVTAEVSKPLLCSYREPSGVPCRTVVTVITPVALCAEHEVALRAHLARAVLSDWGLSVEDARKLVASCMKPISSEDVFYARSPCKGSARVPAKSSHESVVYYISFADRIKIGKSSNLAKRLAGVPHDEVLATEPGGYDLEKERHQQFAALRIIGEWFMPGEELLAHIAALQAQPRVPKPRKRRSSSDSMLSSGEAGQLLGVDISTVCSWTLKGYLKKAMTAPQGHALYRFGDLLTAMRKAQAKADETQRAGW